MANGLPSVNIVFKSAAQATIQQSGAGAVALVLKDAAVAVVTEYKIRSVDEVPVGLTAANKGAINLALAGIPQMVKAVVIPAAAADYSTALSYLETIQFNVVTIPSIATADVSAIATWAKGMYDTKDRKIMAVLPSNAADHPAVVNFVTDNIVSGATTYTTTQFLPRIAGLIAGLPLTVAPTYQVLSDVTDVPKLTKSEADALIAAGKLILYHDGEKVKIARGVTSLVTLTASLTSDWQKIKVVRVLNQLYTDIKKTIEGTYIGKFQNSYINKLLLVSALNVYFDELEAEGILDPGKNSADIDLSAQRTYLKSIMSAADVDVMTDQEVRESNTRDKVFLTTKARPLDAIEDVSMNVYL